MFSSQSQPLGQLTINKFFLPKKKICVIIIPLKTNSQKITRVL